MWKFGWLRTLSCHKTPIESKQYFLFLYLELINKYGEIGLGISIYLFFISCAKDTEPGGDLNGTYNGSFLRTGDMEDAGSVRMVFVADIFSGETTASQLNICYGNYDIFGDSISFKNLCSGNDLLEGNYKIREAGDSLYFSRMSTDTPQFTDYFILKKQ